MQNETGSKNSKLSPNLYFQKKCSTKNIQKNVSHTSKKCPLNVHPRKVLKPKTILCKKFLWMYLQEKSLNPKQLFAKSDQEFCKIRPNVQKYMKILNGFTTIYIAAIFFFGGARRYFPADGKLIKISTEIWRNSSAELLCRLT